MAFDAKRRPPPLGDLIPEEYFEQAEGVEFIFPTIEPVREPAIGVSKYFEIWEAPLRSNSLPRQVTRYSSGVFNMRQTELLLKPSFSAMATTGRPDDRSLLLSAANVFSRDAG
jgi:hypothetical protein